MIKIRPRDAINASNLRPKSNFYPLEYVRGGHFYTEYYKENDTFVILLMLFHIFINQFNQKRAVMIEK